VQGSDLMARRRGSNIEGLKELERTIQRLGALPQKCVTKAARKGANVALKAARQNAPVETGDLKKGLKLNGERARIRGKKVFQVSFNRNMNDQFVKLSKDGNKRYYYPASQEFGFMNRGGGYTPGFRYLRQSIDEHRAEIERTTVSVLASEIDKLR
jgi:HK97 gp10 family phage protein